MLGLNTMWKRPRKLTVILASIMLALLFAHLGTLVAQYAFGHDNLLGLLGMFDLDRERNAPSVFSVSLLLLAAGLLAKIAMGQKGGRKPHASRWVALAIVFVYLALDEGLEVHERVSLATAALTGSQRFGFYAWIIPYGLAALIFMVIYLRFLRQLPRAIAVQIIIAGAIYVFGALGAEGLAGVYVYFHDTEQTLGYRLIAAFEEICEMVGTVWFIDALLTYIDIQKTSPQSQKTAS